MMVGYEQFSQSVEAISKGQQPEITKVIDGYEVSLRNMPYGYFLCGKIPVKWDGSEQELQRHLRISMSCFNDFEASLAMARDNTLYLSHYLAKPRNLDELLSSIESLVNLIDVWVEMAKSLKLS